MILFIHTVRCVKNDLLVLVNKETREQVQEKKG